MIAIPILKILSSSVAYISIQPMVCCFSNVDMIGMTILRSSAQELFSSFIHFFCLVLAKRSSLKTAPLKDFDGSKAARIEVEVRSLSSSNPINLQTSFQYNHHHHLITWRLRIVFENSPAREHVFLPQSNKALDLLYVHSIE